MRFDFDAVIERIILVAMAIIAAGTALFLCTFLVFLLTGRIPIK